MHQLLRSIILQNNAKQYTILRYKRPTQNFSSGPFVVFQTNTTLTVYLY